VLGELHKNAGTKPKPEKKWFSPSIFAVERKNMLSKMEKD
jgi:hypothetical protein